jgi:hypothetical protein
MRSFYQDWLGTNIGKALKNRLFSQESPGAGSARKMDAAGFGAGDTPLKVSRLVTQGRTPVESQLQPEPEPEPEPDGLALVLNEDAAAAEAAAAAAAAAAEVRALR